jgi:signal transduction histidine kinase
VLSEVPLAATTTRHRDRVSLRLFLDEVAVAANLHAEYGEIRFAVEPVDPTLAVVVDPQLLSSALMNLLHNAFNYTRAHGQVTLRTRVDDGRVLIEVEDQCGGTGRTDADLFRPLGQRRGSDRSDLGIGLSICREAVKAIGGEVRTRKLPDEGCIFAIELPLAPEPGLPS